MKSGKLIERARKFSRPYRVANKKKFRLKDVDPGDTQDFESKDKARAKEALQEGVVVAAAVIDALASLDLHYPKVTSAKKKELAAARALLLEKK